MTEDIPFLPQGEPLPVDVEGRDVNGLNVRLDDVLADHERVLLYFYPFDERSDAPDAWRALEEQAGAMRERGVAVLGVRGPREATRNARLEGLAFPVLEDHNYALGQAVGLLGGGRGDDLDASGPPRGIVLLDGDGRVLDARRGDERRVLDDVLGRI